jgi:glycine cleavage system aminomethyltransferase T
LRTDGNVVARITSSIYSPRLEAPLALAYVRRGMETPGTVLESEQGKQTVIDLPVTE